MIKQIEARFTSWIHTMKHRSITKQNKQANWLQHSTVESLQSSIHNLLHDLRSMGLINVVIAVVSSKTQTHYSNSPAGNLVIFYCFYHIWHLCIFIPFISMQFYHVTITFPVVVEQQDSSTISCFVFFTHYLLGL